MKSRAIPATLLAVALALAPLPALAATPATPAPASTPAPDPGAVTWSVRPADAAGNPDGRSWIEWEADPGHERTERLVVSNYGNAPVDFRLSAADGYFTDTGRFTMLPSDRASVDAGTWISLPDSVTVDAGGTAVVPFTISVPEDATPGDHPAGLAASILSPGEGTVGVESRVGFRVMTRVTGELTAALAAGAAPAYAGSINPFEPGDVDVQYELTNTGNTRLRTHPVVTVSGPFGIAATELAGAEIVDIAPGETRTGTVRVENAWPLLWYDARIEARPEAVSDELSVTDATPASAGAVAPALPWSQLVALILAAALVVWWVRARAHARARTERLIEQARSEARAEAAGTAAETPLPAPASHGPRPVEQDPAVPAGGSRRSRRAATSALALVLLAAAGLGLAVVPAPAVRAEDLRPSSSIGVEVDITPLPATPQPSTTPRGTPAPSPGHEGNALPPTGGTVDPLFVAVGVLLLTGGAAVAVQTGRRARRSASTNLGDVLDRGDFHRSPSEIPRISEI